MAVRRHSHEEDAEGYFASISDLMVGILFIFLLMLTVFALNFADEDKDQEIRRLRVELDRTTAQRDQARSRVSSLESALASLISQVANIEADIDTARERLRKLRGALLKQLQQKLAARDVMVEISAQQDVLRLPSEEIFVLGSANLTPRGRERVSAVLDEMAHLLPCYATGASVAQTAGCTETAPIFETVLIEGHTDAIPADNWRLSTDRARAVLDMIQHQYAGLFSLRNPSGQPLLGLAGYGESRTLPEIAPTDPRNRRIELRFLLSSAQEQEAQALRNALADLRRRLEELQVK